MSRTPKSLIEISIAVIIVFFLYGCAQIVAPTGGPIDKTPPVVIHSTPPNYSIQFEGQEIRLHFDEFVALQNINNHFLSSPPLGEIPDIRLRGRSMIMTFKDTLRANTTYVFYFGESVADITEGNVIPNFQFVLSTGQYVDSLSVTGQVLNAATMQPEDGIFVMMYDNVFDSVPLLQRPVYLSKTDTIGRFSITNMRAGNYLMFALSDLNFNFIYDLPEERIAFVDSLVQPGYEQIVHPVWPVINDEPVEQDLRVDDTTYLSGSDNYSVSSPNQRVPFIEMLLFDEKDLHQRLISASLERRGKVNFAFRIPVDSVIIRDYRNLYGQKWYMREYSPLRDTLTLWLPAVKGDTLFVEVSDRGQILDTLGISLTPREVRGRRGDVDTEPQFILRPEFMPVGNVHPYFRPFTINSMNPIDSANFQNIRVFTSDSIPLSAVFEFGDLARRKIVMSPGLLPDSSYKLLIPPGTFTDIFGNKNDTVQFRFTTNNPAVYGSILVNIRLPEGSGQHLLQLLNTDFEVLDEKTISQGNTYSFNHLAAKKYRLRLVVDENKNGIWDTGHYLERKQPERVFVYEKEIQARLNWEVEVIWDL